jgi:hypothetical protein
VLYILTVADLKVKIKNALQKLNTFVQLDFKVIIHQIKSYGQNIFFLMLLEVRTKSNCFFYLPEPILQ